MYFVTKTLVLPPHSPPPPFVRKAFLQFNHKKTFPHLLCTGRPIQKGHLLPLHKSMELKGGCSGGPATLDMLSDESIN